jgi:hypothetical protein
MGFLKPLSPAEQLVWGTLRARDAAQSGRLIPFSEIRETLGSQAPTGLVNSVMWSLVCRGLVDVHAHDHPNLLSGRERELVMWVAGRAYVGVAIRFASPTVRYVD